MSDETILNRLAGAALEVRAVIDQRIEEEGEYEELAINEFADQLDIPDTLVRALLAFAEDVIGAR